MRLPSIFYDAKQKYHIFLGTTKCSHCEKKILRKTFLMANVFWSKNKKNSGFKTYCLNCWEFQVPSRFAVVNESFLCVASDTINKNCEMVILRPPTLVSRNLSVFDLATNNLCGEVVIDNTNLSGRDLLNCKFIVDHSRDALKSTVKRLETDVCEENIDEFLKGFSNDFIVESKAQYLENKDGK